MQSLMKAHAILRQRTDLAAAFEVVPDLLVRVGVDVHVAIGQHLVAQSRELVEGLHVHLAGGGLCVHVS